MTSAKTISKSEVTKSSRGKAAGKVIHAAILFALPFATSSCEAIKAQRAKELAEQRARSLFIREEVTEPFIVARAFYGSQPAVKAMLEVQDDTSSSFRGLHRVGDGLISIGIKDGRGRWLRTHECGGHLFVEATEGQPCQIVVKNNARTRLEIVAGIDGADAVNAGPFNLSNQGIVVAPLQTIVIGKVKRHQPAKLIFGRGRDASRGPVVMSHVAPSNGSIIVCAFRPKDRFPWEGSISRPMHTTAMPGKFPQRRFEPEPYSEDYR